MKINLIYPKTEEGIEALQERIDVFHGEYIMEKINDLDCSYKRKVELLDEIRESFSKKEVS